MASCCARRRPPTRCAPSWSRAAIRTTSTGVDPALPVADGAHGRARCGRTAGRRRRGMLRRRHARPRIGGDGGADLGPVGRGLSATRCDPWPLNPNGELLLGVKLESPEGIANCEEILAVPGLGFAEIGPGDLGLSLGYASRAARALSAGDAGGARPRAGGLPPQRHRLPAKAARRRTSSRGSTRACG